MWKIGGQSQPLKLVWHFNLFGRGSAKDMQGNVVAAREVHRGFHYSIDS